LLLRDLVEPVDERQQQIMEASEGEWGLALEPAGGQDAEIGRGLNRVPQESGLADSGLASKDEGCSFRAAGSPEQTVDPLSLQLAAQEH
jgi:hypothetical protein